MFDTIHPALALAGSPGSATSVDGDRPSVGSRRLAFGVLDGPTDLPIGCWTSAALLDVVGGSRGRDAAQRLIGLGLVFVPVTAAAGLADWSTVRDDPTRRVGAAHAALNVAASACYVQSWRHRRKDRHWRGVGWGLVGGAVMSASGYLGGHLSFGRTGDDDQETTEAQIDLRSDERGAPAGQQPASATLGAA